MHAEDLTMAIAQRQCVSSIALGEELEQIIERFLARGAGAAPADSAAL